MSIIDGAEFWDLAYSRRFERGAFGCVVGSPEAQTRVLDNRFYFPEEVSEDDIVEITITPEVLATRQIRLEIYNLFLSQAGRPARTVRQAEDQISDLGKETDGPTIIIVKHIPYLMAKEMRHVITVITEIAWHIRALVLLGMDEEMADSIQRSKDQSLEWIRRRTNGTIQIDPEGEVTLRIF